MFKPSHSNLNCKFKLKPYLYTKEFLSDFLFLDKLQPCTCFQAHFVHNCPDYQNLQLSTEEFETLALDSGEFVYDHTTPYTYRLNDPGSKAFRDPYIKAALKEYDEPYYYSLADRNKTPHPGHMYFSLLQYTYPMAKPPSKKERYFYDSLESSINYVLRNFDPVQPCSAQTIIHSMPKNTSTGWLALKHFQKAVKKEDMMPIITREYYHQYQRISKQQRVDDYTILAMRGHLSDREKKKTRPVWLVSATTIISELRYYTPFYEQMANKEFFKKRVIHGKKSMSRLRKWMSKSDEYTMVNTDISGWDSFRARWFHELIMKKIGKLINFENIEDRREFEFCIDQAIRTKVLLPNGHVIRKRAGIISGTAGTLLFNTLLNMILSYTIMNMMKLVDLEYCDLNGNKIENENWLGDDFAFYIAKLSYFDLDKYKALIFKYFDLFVKKEKVIIAENVNDRKYLGYQLKGGLLFREERDLFASVLYSERFFKVGEQYLAISFSRFFSYLLIGGINNVNFLRFFYYYMGKYSNRLLNIKFIFDSKMDNIFKLIKDVWNVNIPSFNINTFRSMNLELLKYVLLYDTDLRIEDLIV